MFLNEKEKGARTKVLEGLLGKMDEMDSKRLNKGKSDATEISVIEASPLEKEMTKAGHDGVEEVEEKIFPDEEAKEEQMEMGGEEPSEEQKQMIKALYEKYCM